MPPSLTLALLRAAQLHPQREALVCQGRRWRFAQLQDRVARLAAVLRQLGLRPGDRVGVLARNADRLVELLLATWWAGGIVNPLNTRWSVAEMVRALDDCETRLLFVDDGFLPLRGALQAQSQALPALVLLGDGAGLRLPAQLPVSEALLARAAPLADAGRCGSDLAGVFYTGGTGGAPKGVMLDHAALVTNGWLSLIAAPLPSDATLLHCAPLFHQAGLSHLLRGLIQGCRQVLLPGFEPEAVLAAVVAERVSHLMLPTPLLQGLVDHPARVAADLGSLRAVVYGAAPAAEGLVERACRALPGVQFLQAYGLTEAAAVVCCLDAGQHAGAGLRSAGWPLPGVLLRIVDAQGRELPRGEVGEILVRSPSLMQGYWRQPQATARALRDGWLHTGDAGRYDPQGRLQLLDRLDDVIVCGGRPVYSAEVEHALSRHPAVAQAAVIGVPDAAAGQAVHAVVVCRPGTAVDADALLAWCRGRLAAPQCPASVEFRELLPTSGTGKVMKRRLREPFWTDARTPARHAA